MTALIIGVDGGGTSTRCVAVHATGEATGEVAGRGRAGGANAWSAAEPSAGLLAALRAALEGLDTARVIGGVFGLAGAGQAEQVAARAWREARLPGRPSVVPDMLVAFTGATAEPDGRVLVAGTGAVAARIEHRQVVRRADGHGWLVGDEGSGVWLGRQAVSAALAALDGRGPHTALVGRVIAALFGAERPAGAEEIGFKDVGAQNVRAQNVQAPDVEAQWVEAQWVGEHVLGEQGARRRRIGEQEIVSAVYRRVAESGPAWLGTLAPEVDAAARGGDPVAREILCEAARLLARTVRALDRPTPGDLGSLDRGPGDGTAFDRAAESPDQGTGLSGPPVWLPGSGGEFPGSCAGPSGPGTEDEKHAVDGGPLVLAGSLLTEPTELARRVRAELGEQERPLAARDGAAGAAALALHACLPPEEALRGHLRLIGAG